MTKTTTHRWSCGRWI